MRKASLLAMTALAGLALAAPANAEYTPLGGVDVGRHMERGTDYSRFGGPVENIQLTARDSDVDCRSVRVRYDDGDTDRVFSGHLRQGDPVNLDLHGRDHRIASIHFACRAENGHGHIQIAANVGRFRQAWEHSRDWAGHWAHVFGQRMGFDEHHGDQSGYQDTGWRTIGRENFAGHRDWAQAYAGDRGEHLDRIALKPVDSDARCTRVKATFDNGNTRDLDMNRDYLERGRLTVIDLPGKERDVRSIALHCRPVGDRDVTIEVLGQT